MIRIHVIGMPEPIVTRAIDFERALRELREHGVLEVPLYDPSPQVGQVTAVALPATSIRFIEDVSEGRV